MAVIFAYNIYITIFGGSLISRHHEILITLHKIKVCHNIAIDNGITVHQFEQDEHILAIL